MTDGKAIDYLAVGPLGVRLTNGSSPEYTHADHLGSPECVGVQRFPAPSYRQALLS